MSQEESKAYFEAPSSTFDVADTYLDQYIASLIEYVYPPVLCDN
jgi:hypothetical protein